MVSCYTTVPEEKTLCSCYFRPFFNKLVVLFCQVFQFSLSCFNIGSPAVMLLHQIKKKDFHLLAWYLSFPKSVSCINRERERDRQTDRDRDRTYLSNGKYVLPWNEEQGFSYRVFQTVNEHSEWEIFVWKWLIQQCNF